MARFPPSDRGEAAPGRPWRSPCWEWRGSPGWGEPTPPGSCWSPSPGCRGPCRGWWWSLNTECSPVCTGAPCTPPGRCSGRGPAPWSCASARWSHTWPRWPPSPPGAWEPPLVGPRDEQLGRESRMFAWSSQSPHPRWRPSRWGCDPGPLWPGPDPRWDWGRTGPVYSWGWWGTVRSQYCKPWPDRLTGRLWQSSHHRRDWPAQCVCWWGRRSPSSWPRPSSTSPGGAAPVQTSTSTSHPNVAPKTPNSNLCNLSSALTWYVCWPRVDVWWSRARLGTPAGLEPDSGGPETGRPGEQSLAQIWLGSDCDGANLAQNVFNMELKQPGHHISLLPSCVISSLLHLLISSRPFHHLGLLSRLSAGVAEVWSDWKDWSALTVDWREGGILNSVTTNKQKQLLLCKQFLVSSLDQRSPSSCPACLSLANQ